jgi:hypothetical protein
MGPLGLWMEMQWLSKYLSFFLFTMSFSSLHMSASFSSCTNHVLCFYFRNIIFFCVSIVSWLREIRVTKKKMIK